MIEIKVIIIIIVIIQAKKNSTANLYVAKTLVEKRWSKQTKRMLILIRKRMNQSHVTMWLSIEILDQYIRNSMFIKMFP